MTCWECYSTHTTPRSNKERMFAPLVVDVSWQVAPSFCKKYADVGRVIQVTLPQAVSSIDEGVELSAVSDRTHWMHTRKTSKMGQKAERNMRNSSAAVPSLERHIHPTKCSRTRSLPTLAVGAHLAW